MSAKAVQLVNSFSREGLILGLCELVREWSARDGTVGDTLIAGRAVLEEAVHTVEALAVDIPEMREVFNRGYALLAEGDPERYKEAQSIEEETERRTAQNAFEYVARIVHTDTVKREYLAAAKQLQERFESEREPDEIRQEAFRLLVGLAPIKILDTELAPIELNIPIAELLERWVKMNLIEESLPPTSKRSRKLSERLRSLPPLFTRTNSASSSSVLSPLSPPSRSQTDQIQASPRSFSFNLRSPIRRKTNEKELGTLDGVAHARMSERAMRRYQI